MATDYYNIFLLWERPVIVFALLVFPLGVAVLYPIYWGRRREMYPPCRGWIPWLGCAVQFGKAPLDFIEESRRKVSIKNVTLGFKPYVTHACLLCIALGCMCNCSPLRRSTLYHGMETS